MTRKILILSTHQRGGIRSVVEAYGDTGFYRQWNAEILWTNDETSLARKLIMAGQAFAILLWNLIRRRVRLVHVHLSMRGSAWRKGIYIALTRLFRVPVVLHLHGSEFKEYYQAASPAKQRFVRRMFDRACVVVVLSRAWRDFVSTITTAEIRIVPNFVTCSEPRKAPPNDGVHLLFLGAFGRRKGIYDLIEVVSRIKAKGGALSLVCAGNGEVDEVRRKVTELGVQDQVHVAGWVAGEEKERLWDEANVFILPSYNEGLPMAILEAMCKGKAVISTRVGGIPEAVIEGRNGSLVTPGDLQALERVLTALIEHPENITTLGSNSRTLYETQYSPDAALGIMSEIYRHCSGLSK